MIATLTAALIVALLAFGYAAIQLHNSVKLVEKYRDLNRRLMQESIRQAISTKING